MFLRIYTSKSPVFALLYLNGIFYGPLSIVIDLLILKGNRKYKSALYCGAFTQAAFFFLLGSLLVRSILSDTPTLATILLFVFINIKILLFARICTFIYRYLSISVYERETKGLLFQIYMFFKRDLIVQFRNWKELLFHFLQISFGGVFLGFIFYGRHYQGPMFDIETYNCTNSLLLSSSCGLAIHPADDPLVTIGSLSSLTVAICAVSYSINIFGKEINIFQRETSTGSITGAYFIGKTLAQIPCSLFAPVCFLLSFGGLVPLNADLGIHYAILALTYATFSGVGYFVSLVTPPAISQLAGIFWVLLGIMFSGSQPTLIQLKNNLLIGFVTFLPSYLSFSRWSQELFYLLEYPFYTHSYTIPGQLYDYFVSDTVLCWCACCTILIAFRVATYVRLVLLEQK